LEATANVSIAAALATVAASGAIPDLSTTVLVSAEQMIQALEKGCSERGCLRELLQRPP
jgi:hypothetical protein